jgi:hypothetical protein
MIQWIEMIQRLLEKMLLGQFRTGGVQSESEKDKKLHRLLFQVAENMRTTIVGIDKIKRRSGIAQLEIIQSTHPAMFLVQSTTQTNCRTSIDSQFHSAILSRFRRQQSLDMKKSSENQLMKALEM